MTDQECADIALVHGTVRGELLDVRRALSHGAKPDTIAGLTLKMGAPKETKQGEGGRMTPLMRACLLGNAEIMEALLEARASPALCDGRGWNALCYALSAGEVDLARRLLDLTEKKRALQKKVACQHEQEIVEQCRRVVSQEAAALVQKEFGHHGFLVEKSLTFADPAVSGG